MLLRMHAAMGNVKLEGCWRRHLHGSCHQVRLPDSEAHCCTSSCKSLSNAQRVAAIPCHTCQRAFETLRTHAALGNMKLRSGGWDLTLEQGAACCVQG